MKNYQLLFKPDPDKPEDAELVALVAAVTFTVGEGQAGSIALLSDVEAAPLLEVGLVRDIDIAPPGAGRRNLP